MLSKIFFYRRTTDDDLTWRWTTSGSFSVKSLYDQLFSAGKVKDSFVRIWKAKFTTTRIVVITVEGKMLVPWT
jgi:hypothetical protein